jgi:chitinase
VTYAFANIGSDLKIAMGDPSIDPANFDKLKQLKQQYPSLKTLISVGGWDWSGKFSDVALSDASRTAFADSAVAFMKQYGFDGVDIDWEYPGGGGMSSNVSRPADKTNFTLMMAKLREKLDAQGALDGQHYLLSFAGASGTFYANQTELSKLADYVDFATVMTYDMHGPWPGSLTDFNAPLYTPSENTPQYKWSCNAAVQLWTSQGFPKTKLIMGIPFYGIKFNGVPNTGKGLYQTFTSGSSITYDKIVSTYLSDPAYTRYVHADALVPWLFNGSTFISYDDPQSVTEKAKYIKNTGLGGAAIWELSQNADGTMLGALKNNIQ